MTRCHSSFGRREHLVWFMSTPCLVDKVSSKCYWDIFCANKLVCLFCFAVRTRTAQIDLLEHGFGFVARG